MAKYSALFLIVCLALTSCNGLWGKRVRGNGHIKSEERSVSSFKDVDVSGAVNVYVSQGDTRSVKLETDENLLPYLEVIQEGDKIEIRTKRGYNLDPTDEIKAYVTSPQFRRIDVSGACNITGETKITSSDGLDLQVSGAGDIKMDVDAPRIKAEISGSGSINLKGHSKDVDLDLTGAAHAHCYDLMAENTTIDISGAGDAEVFASVKLDAQVSGAGSVTYKGNATNVSQHVSGAGSVKKSD